MDDIIHVLPDSVANQIAAGEVIQRPASVIKELVENSIDAGANHIQVLVVDAGRTSIQVIDNGKGMSETDARLAFERHATSKITNANDLFSLHTMGFRGEALASIASVAHVELRTRRPDDELGTDICIVGCKVESQKPVSCPQGCNISVKNLFYNLPARRKFLKSNSTEFSHIEKDFLKIALVYPEIHFELSHTQTTFSRPEETLCYNLQPSSYRERIVNVFGRGINSSFNSNLLSINADSSIVRIFGFVGRPETAKKQNDKQYFFVNGRYMRHPYFHKAVIQAFDRMLMPNTSPDYFIYFDIDPSSIDVNVHPTKTEIKFEHERDIYPIILAAIKESLGKFNIAPSIDFDRDGDVDMPMLKGDTIVEMPNFTPSTSYNPFETNRESQYGFGEYKRSRISDDWSKLYDSFEKETNLSPANGELEIPSHIFDTDDNKNVTDTAEDFDKVSLNSFQFRSKYIITSVRSGLMCIDQHRAHVRILYDTFLRNFELRKSVSQKLLFPELFTLMPAETMVLNEIMEDLNLLGFEISDMGNNTYSVNGVPAFNVDIDAKEYIISLIDSVKDSNSDVKDEISERLASSFAEMVAIPYGKMLTQEEMEDIINGLFACSNHYFTPNNKKIISIISDHDMDAMFK